MNLLPIPTSTSAPANSVPEDPMTAAFFDRSSSQSGARLASLIGILLLGAACLAAAIAPAAAAADPCPNAAFRTGAAAHLPECRAYEMISPPYKLANPSVGGGMRAWPSPDGNRMRYLGRVDGLPNGDFDNLVATRGPNGWTTLPVAPMEDRGDYDYLGGGEGPTTPDLSAFTLVTMAGAILNYRNLPYKIQIVRPGQSVQTIATIPGEEPPKRLHMPYVSGASDDLSHVLWEQPFEDLDPLAVDPPAPEIENGVRLLYEWVDGVRTIVSANPDGSLISKCGSVAGNGERDATKAENAMSADGSRVFFRAPDPRYPACESEPSRLYIREGMAAPRLISAPEPGVSDPNGHQPDHFIAASPNGDKVFFSTTEQLTSQDAPGDSDLYLYDASSQELKLVTVAPDGTGNAHIYSALVSHDGSTVYVLLQRPMVAGTGDPSMPNLYKYDVGTGQWTFVATLAGGDPHIFTPDWNGYTTNSGRFLLFRTQTNFSTGEPAPRRIYRYDSLKEEMSCVSCLPDGGSSPGAEPTWGWTHMFVGQTLPQRGISEDGKTVVFDTADALVPADTNQVSDVYEWHNGTLSLISTGSGDAFSAAAGMSVDGRDIFFSTPEQLLPQDQDSYPDLYDARIGGGFSPGGEGPLCSGDSCSVSAAPPFQVSRPASAEVRGPGNLGRGKRVKRALEILAPGRAARSQAARTGILRLKVHTSGAGRLRALAQARIRGIRRVVARAAKGVRRAGNVTLPLHLSPGARQVLVEDGVLNLSISVSLSGAHGKTTTVSIRRSR